MSSVHRDKGTEVFQQFRALLSRLPVYLFSLSIVGILAIGWHQRNEYWLTAERGLGYALGIIGGVMMLVMLLYPLRKNLKIMSGLLRVKDWFRAHMVLGILGPTLILFHSNFQLGSTNSNVALFSMLLVVLSGLIGRYVYQQIHVGLYGSKMNYGELLADYNAKKHLRDLPPAFAESIGVELGLIESKATQSATSLWGQWRSMRSVSKSSSQVIRQLKKTIRRQKKTLLPSELEQLLTFKFHLRQEVAILKDISRLSLFTQLFSLWHILHLPIFLMLVVTAIVHVVAVHMY